jgi:hypothetical protein
MSVFVSLREVRHCVKPVEAIVFSNACRAQIDVAHYASNPTFLQAASTISSLINYFPYFPTVWRFFRISVIYMLGVMEPRAPRIPIN